MVIMNNSYPLAEDGFPNNNRIAINISLFGVMTSFKNFGAVHALFRIVSLFDSLPSLSKIHNLLSLLYCLMPLTILLIVRTKIIKSY